MKIAQKIFWVLSSNFWVLMCELFKTQKFWTLSGTQPNRLDTQESDFVHWCAILNIKHYATLDNVYENHMMSGTFHLTIMFINQVRHGRIIMFTFLLYVTINVVNQICLGTAHNVMERSEMELWAVPRLCLSNRKFFMQVLFW